MRKFGVVFAFLVLLSAAASASVIQLTSKISTENLIKESSTGVNASIVNTGDEPAYNVILSLILPDGFSSEPITVGVLNPNEPFEGKFQVRIGENVLPGLHPLVLLTNYADANSYPFSTISARLISYKQTTPIKVYGTLSPAEISGSEKKTLTLSVRNMDDKPHNIKADLHLPQELKVDEADKTLTVAGKDEANAEFTVSSFGALGGSSYAVFAIVTYEDNGLSYTSIAGNAVKVVGVGQAKANPQAKTEGGDSSGMVYALTASLAVLIAAGLFYRRKGK